MKNVFLFLSLFLFNSISNAQNKNVDLNPTWELIPENN